MNASHGFTLIRKQQIDELQTECRLYRHDRTGAELLSCVNADTNKVFGITFRTPPADSTGIAHILEHSVLCGSRKYPVKEPFVELLKGSLQTFLNAFTYPDKTCYPVASQNLQDFYNLIDVYLDAVFYPRITPLIFQQEGWHLEPGEVTDTLTMNGVVFNEMKGAYSSPDNLLHHYSQQSLFPDTVYSFDSGGDPRHIPDLTYEQFREFHHRYYHPSNARIFFYGDDKPDQRLALLNRCLQEFNPLQPHSDIPAQPHLTRPAQFNKAFPAASDGASADRGMVTVNWLLPPTTDIQASLALSTLEYALVGMPGSPLRKALLESELGSGLAGVGLESELRQMYFSTGLKGALPADASRIEALVCETLAGLAEGGLDQRTVEAALNSVEFRLRENNTGHFPRGLALMLRALTTWLYNGDPLAPLAFEQPLRALRTAVIQDPAFFSGLIRRHLVDNPHRTTVVLTPDPGLAAQQRTDEERRLADLRAAMTDERLRSVAAGCEELKRMQQTPDPPDALAAIPCLKLGDIERRNTLIPCEVSIRNGTRVLYHDLFTGGICYCDIGLDLHLLPQELLPYTKIFGRALLETGAGKEDFVSLSQRIGCATGGIVPGIFTAAAADAPRGCAWLMLRGKAVDARVPELLSIFTDILRQARLNSRERIKQIITEERVSLEHRLFPAGHQFVSRRLRAHFHEADWADEQMNGLDYVQFLRSLENKIDTDWAGVLTDLQTIRDRLVNAGAMVLNVTADRSAWQSLGPQIDRFLAGLPRAAARPVPWSPALFSENEGLTIPSQVNYVGKAINLYRHGYSYHGSIHVITHMLRTAWLWEQVRVRGGAYGAFSIFDRMSGTLVFASYRDPNLLKTVDTFDRAADWLARLRCDERELHQSIIGAIGDIDAYLLPDARGFVSLQRFLSAITDEDRQRMREQVLETSPDDLRACAEALHSLKEHGITKVLGDAGAIAAANAETPDRFAVQNIL
jgi:presequence protease